MTDSSNEPPAALFNHMFTWIHAVPHNDNCYVSDEHPGNTCVCGKDSLVEEIEKFRAGQPPSTDAPAAQFFIDNEGAIDYGTPPVDDYGKQLAGAWRPIEEKPPSCLVLAATSDGYVFAGQFTDGEWVMEDGNRVVSRVTHWMPWPSAPTKRNEP
jgi:hypothetical protein